MSGRDSQEKSVAAAGRASASGQWGAGGEAQQQAARQGGAGGRAAGRGGKQKQGRGGGRQKPRSANTNRTQQDFFDKIAKPLPKQGEAKGAAGGAKPKGGSRAAASLTPPTPTPSTPAHSSGAHTATPQTAPSPPVSPTVPPLETPLPDAGPADAASGASALPVFPQAAGGAPRWAPAAAGSAAAPAMPWEAGCAETGGGGAAAVDGMAGSFHDMVFGAAAGDVVADMNGDGDTDTPDVVLRQVLAALSEEDE